MADRKNRTEDETPVVCLISLGCPKNTVDSERLLGGLLERGWLFAERPEDADVALVNTCGFLADARDESAGVLEELLALKGRTRLKAVGAMGCMVARDAPGAADILGQVDLVLTFNDYTRLPEILAELIGRSELQTANPQAFEAFPRMRSGYPWSAYLKISDGCDHTCTFCSIPKIKGAHRSIDMDTLLAEAQALAAGGVRELNLVAQDSTFYGLDTHQKQRLPELLEKLSQVESLEWIRVLYAYPSLLSDGIIDAMASLDKIVPYLDMPLQHGANSILRAMRREADHHRTVDRIARLRRAIPDVALRTTFIVGFPGETDRDVDALQAFMEEVEFSHVGIFTFSREPGTPSFDLPRQISPELAEERKRRLMLYQQQIVERRLLSLEGTTVDAIIDNPGNGECQEALGRTLWDAPEVDGGIRVRGDGLCGGDIVRVHIDGHEGYDLLGHSVKKKDSKKTVSERHKEISKQQTA